MATSIFVVSFSSRSVVCSVLTSVINAWTCFDVLYSFVLDGAAAALKFLYADIAHQTPRPYILPELSSQAVVVGQQIYRFPVTGDSSAGTFMLMTGDAPASFDLGVLPHLLQLCYENFYCSKDSIVVWAEIDSSGENAQVLIQDYGAFPQNTTHTFQMLDPDTTLAGLIAPGGFEECP